MTEQVEIYLAGQPHGKGRPRFSTRGGFARAYTDAKTASFEEALRVTAAVAMGNRAPLEGPLAMSVIATMKIPKSWSKSKRADAAACRIRPTTKPDCDNIAKCCDALNLLIYNDDSQIVRLLVHKVYGEEPGLRVIVREVEVDV